MVNLWVPGCLCRVAAPQVFHHPRLQTLMQTYGSHSCRTWLGMYKAPTWKPVRLVANDAWVHKMYRTVTSSRFQQESNDLFNVARRKLDKRRFGKSTSTIRYNTADGKARFKGSRLLKSTQIYPRSFGRNASWPHVTPAPFRSVGEGAGLSKVARQFLLHANSNPEPCKTVDYSDDPWSDARQLGGKVTSSRTHPNPVACNVWPRLGAVELWLRSHLNKRANARA